MSTVEKPQAVDPMEQADQDAVWQAFLRGEPLDPEVRRRVDERAQRITDEIRRVHGIIDDETFEKLLSDDDDS
jgi:hypothetical protein